MRTGKELILATKIFATEDRTKSWYYMLSTLILMVFSLGLTFWNINFGFKIAASIVSGLLLVRMFVIYHDHQHNAILNQSKAANFIMHSFSIYILAPSSIWKRSHDFHHKHNSKLHVSDIGSFPTVTKEQYINFTNKQKLYYLALRHPLNIFFGYITVFMLSFCINSAVKSTRKHWDCLVALILHFSFGAILFYYGGVLALLLTLVIPHTIACGLGSYLFYVQHNFPKVKFRLMQAWRYEHAAIESTSFFLMHPIMNWFTGNIGYHHVHHMNSRIPFYRLQEAMEKIPELQQVYTTTFSIKDIVACLELKLWDSEQNRMITLKELD